MIYLCCGIWFTLTILAWGFILARGRRADSEPEQKNSRPDSAFESKKYAGSTHLDSNVGI
jgi:hypothetical protein